ncbi:hypothetical protein AB0I60_09540 [Actinosynnema sp. NPDC050436]|uniref:hypothetical protein n=1 Tax=Actinosynnema sp. NPDC050436 TaxID=3155659 RepID=UPI00340DFEF1
MSEAELREGLRAAVGDEPPLTFDADALIARAQSARAARKRRRALVVVGVATVVLMGTVLSLPGVLTPKNPVGIDALSGRVLTTTAGPPASGRATSFPLPQPTPSTPWSTTTGLPGGRLTELTTYLEGRFADVVPGTTNVRAEVVEVDEKYPAGLVTASVYFEHRAGTGGVVIHLSGPPVAMSRKDFCVGVKCGTPREQPDGTVVEFAVIPGSSPTKVGYTAAHFRSDGTVVEVTAYSHDPAPGADVRDTVPLSDTQLMVLASDPRLSLS